MVGTLKGDILITEVCEALNREQFLDLAGLMLSLNPPPSTVSIGDIQSPVLLSDTFSISFCKTTLH